MPSDSVKWPLPTIPCKPRGRKVLFDKASDEAKAKFQELFPVSFYKEMAVWFGISERAVYCLGKRLGLKKDHTAIHLKIMSSPHNRMLLCNTLKRIRDEQPERYAMIRKRKSEKLKRLWRVARVNKAYALNFNVKYRPAAMPVNDTKFRYRMKTRYNYFYDLDHPWDICYDSETRRNPEMEKRAITRGFRIVEGEG